MTNDGRPKGVSRIAVVLGVLALCLTLIGGIYFAVGSERFSSFFDPSFKIPKQTSTASKGPQIGGPFELVDHTGAVRTNADFAGKFTLIYFGYTYCPDVCPTSLTAMTDALKSLGSKAKNIVPLFITVDPKRDTVEQLRMYISHFHPRMVGLTGTEEQIAKAANAFRVYFAKQKESTPGANDNLVDHSSIVLFMDQKGRFLTHFGHAVAADAMAERIRKFL
ncbi:SCO family protein [bacterium]|jgi:protein SCO1/2|nr:SCO family protein [bacterium]